MKALTLQQRLNALPSVLRNPQLLSNRGIGNEIGFYIFDYDPECEPVVQQYLPKLLLKLGQPPDPLKVTEINLYHLLLKILEERKLLQKVFDLEASQGSRNLKNRIAPMVRAEQIVAQIQKQVVDESHLILLTGIGASYPLVRSHTILNNLHPILDRSPVVMFFPGSYDGHELRLFNTLTDDNYYRAFPLIPRQERSL
ncbi:DUF1788 domain-containing protein [Pseudanabaenaceae cyanobacterium LEGE 13415]|nr:DUF1788 domain-containing protein [Pseudanabaenaceae cyanobacterium LEGE 13415]